MVRSMTLLMSYAIALICFMGQYSEAKYPVNILDTKLKFTPRLFGVSTVVYNDEMYAYGGRTGLSFEVSNNLYKYSFDLEKKNVSMETVNQMKSGPNCTSCGAVMISQDKMLILTHEHALNKNEPASIDEVVKPYTFDLKTNDWSVPSPENLPKYDLSQKHIFTMRRGHKTILGSDGCVYVVGGLNFFNDSVYMYDSWYYDPTKNEYGVLSDNRIGKTRVYSSLINLPDGNIGVLFGYNEAYNYYESGNMSVISTQSKAWLNDYVSLGGDGPDVAEEITVQTDSSNNYAYFFGGRLDSAIGDTFDNKLQVLDLKNNRWIETINKYEIGVSVKPRYFASSAIINGNFITVFGTEDEDNASEMGDLDIVPVPEELKIASDNPPQKVTVTWKSELDQKNPGPDTIVRMLVERHRFHISISMSLAFSIYIVFLFFSKISVQLAAGSEKYTSIPTFVLKHRAGELVATEINRILTQLICVLIFGAAIGYLSYNTANSSISDTEEFVDVEYQALPDIRFCYSGYYANDSSTTIPHTECQYEYTEADRQNCTGNNIKGLPKEIHMPSFPQQRLSTTCYMYKSSNDSMLPSEYNPTVRFSHIGGAYNLVEAVFIQFYEPNKNPNRVLFFGEDLKDLGIDKMDKWKDTERRSGTSNDIMNHILIAYPESDISVQYEIVHRKVIDVHNPWNYFGVFPQFKEETELIITHNDALDRGRDKLEEDPGKILGSIRVTPNSFQKRIITEKRDTTIIDVLGSVGGVASVLFTVYTILFGARPLRPWGIIQKSTIIQHQPKKKAKQLKHYFDIQAVQGIPLVTPVHSRYSALYNRNVRNNGELERTNNNQSPLPQPNEQKIDDMSDFQRRLEQLEGRNQILELVLKAYYVDDEIFHQLKQARETPDIIPKTDDLESESDSQVTCCNSNINRLRNA